MPSDRRSPRTPRHTVRDPRAPIACTRCRRLKKKCKQGCGTSSPRGKCERCCDTGEVCEYLNVIDDIPRVLSPPPTGLCVVDSESANNGPILQLQWHHTSIETSDTGQQQLVHQNSSSLDTSTPEIENMSNNPDDTRPDYILYPSDWVNLVADPSLSPSYASRSAAESAEYDQQSSISTYPPPTTFNVDAQTSDSMKSYDYYDLTHYEETPQSNIHIKIASAPYEEADASDPYSALNTYPSQVLIAINDPKCLVCSAVNCCEIHPNCVC